ncbi:catechol 2,3-dioxygenase-like lactoylglutathione lyase family enzyme [Alteromonadaceae bacterium 2753L.S.0a.02]|nr:catechol 2,3-dioxygenase-like lactoylglutathione lyase family enzyme [Alteromonadaceae bacterium 2753L.S.0a.02]
MKIYMEHINLHVRDIEATATFIRTAFPHYKVRYDSGANCEERWMHIGDDNCYFAIYQASEFSTPNHQPYSGQVGFNHVGMVVDSAATIQQRLSANGYTESTLENNHPARQRVYFFDPDGNDWEFVEYLSEDPKLRHDYSDA